MYVTWIIQTQPGERRWSFAMKEEILLMIHVKLGKIYDMKLHDYMIRVCYICR